MRSPRRVDPGDRIRAEDHNAIVDALVGRIVDALVGRISGAQGVRVTRGRGGVTISLEDPGLPRGLEARIVEVVTPADPSQRSALNTTYWAVAAGKGDDLAIQFPVDRIFNRPNYNGDALIEPARIGDKCWIRQVFNDAGELEPELVVRTEVFAVTPACPEGESLRDGVLPSGGVGGVGFFAREVELVAGEEGIGHRASGNGAEEGIGHQALGNGAEEGIGHQALGNGAEEGIGHQALGIGVGEDGDGEPRHGVAEATDMHDEIELDDLGNEGWTAAVAVPAGATTCKAQLVASGDGTDPPLCELILGTSLAGHDPVYTGAAGILLPGEVGAAGRTAMSGVFSVEGDGYVHVEVRDPAHGTGLGRGVLHLRFG